MSGLTTHVLDTSRGRPGAGVSVILQRRGEEWDPVARAVTDADGRARLLDDIEPGIYKITFDTGSYFDGETFFPEASVVFEVRDAKAHYHVPLLVSPFGYSTYRGS